MTRFAILGGGNAGAALAAHMKLLGHTVQLYDAFPAAIRDIQRNDNTIHLQGNLPVTGDARMDLVTVQLAEAVQDAEILICTTPAHIHKLLARDLAPLLKPDQTLVLYPGRTGGVLEFRKVLAEHGGPADALIIETQTIAYACRKTEASVNVFGYKQELAFSGLPTRRLDEFEQRIQRIFPNWSKAASLWHTSLHNIGMLFHPTPTLLNLGRMESGVPFDYYIDGFTPSIAKLVEQLDSERLAVAKGMGIELPTVQQWLQSSYGCTGSNLYAALQNNQSYVGIKAPQLKHVDDKLQLRYVVEDVPTGLVPVAALGARLQIPTPTIDAIIDLANAFYRTDFRKTGRTLAQLGLEGYSLDELRNLHFES
jgi:opine dehydrogenase